MSLCNIFSLDSKKKMTFSAEKKNANLSPSSPYATRKKKSQMLKRTQAEGSQLAIKTGVLIYSSIINQNSVFNRHIRVEESCCKIHICLQVLVSPDLEICFHPWAFEHISFAWMFCPLLTLSTLLFCPLELMLGVTS